MPPEASIAGVRMDGNDRRSESVSSFVASRILLSRPGALRGLAAAAIVAPMLVGCTTSGSGPATVANVEAPAAFARERLVGRWGVASFHTDKDRPRTEREARAQCNLPYTIAKGPTDGVMMHVADDPKLYELETQGRQGGQDLSRLRGAAGRPAGSRDSVGDGQSHDSCASSIRTRTGAMEPSYTCAAAPDDTNPKSGGQGFAKTAKES